MRLFIVSILFFSSFTFAADIELKNASIHEFVNFVSKKIKKPIVIGADIDSKLTVYSDYENPDQIKNVLFALARSAGYVVIEKTGFISIGVNTGNNSHQLTTEIFKLKNIQSAFALSIVAPLLDSTSETESFRHSVIESLTTNSIIVTAAKHQLETIKKVIDEIDYKRKQVLISAVIAEISDTDYSDFGASLSFNSNNNTAISNFANFDLGNNTKGANFSFLNSVHVQAFVSMIEGSINSNLLSQPQITVMDRQSGNILIGQNIPVITGSSTGQGSTTSEPFQTIERLDVGLKLQVTPIVTPSGNIELSIYQEISDLSDSNVATDVIINQRSINSSVTLKNGDSLFLGGLKTQTTRLKGSHVPYLWKAPIVGSLFESEKTEILDTNLSIIITATII